MYGSIAQQPDVMGQLGVLTALKILNGQTPEKQTDVPLKVVTKDNV
jgi:ribose transport system substrate-binding protein